MPSNWRPLTTLVLSLPTTTLIAPPSTSALTKRTLAELDSSLLLPQPVTIDAISNNAKRRRTRERDMEAPGGEGSMVTKIEKGQAAYRVAIVNRRAAARR